MKILILLFTTFFFFNSSLFSADSNCLDNKSSAITISLDESIDAYIDPAITSAAGGPGGGGGGGGGITITKDLDYFTFTPSSPEFIAIFTTGDTDTAVRVYDSSCNLYATNSNSGEGDNFFLALPLKAETYYVEVSGEDDDVSGAYTLSLEILPNPINTRLFTKVDLSDATSLNINGSALVIGNQLLCQNTSDGAECTEPTIGVTNNSISQNHVIIDSTSGLTSNSMARLDLREGDEIIWAGLYWSARIYTSSTDNPTAAEIYMKTPTSTTYKKYTSDPDKFNWYASGIVFDYACMQEVTEDVQIAGDGQYFVGGIQASNGGNTFASWALLVVVKNSDRTFRNISVYDGFQAVHNSSDYPQSVDILADGFLTPREEDVTSNLIIYTGESEAGLKDGASLTDSSDIKHDLIDAQGTSNDLFNASISTNGVYRSDSNDPGIADPNFQNVIGTDIDKLTITALDNLQTSTTITIRSDGDRYTLNMFAFETELYIPKFCYDYAYKQDGLYFTEDNDGTNDPRLIGNVSQDSPIELGIYVKNLVNSDIAISDMIVNVIDIDTAQATYARESTMITDIGEVLPVAIEDSTLSVSDAAIEGIDIGTIQSNDYFYLHYKLDPKQSTINMPINVSINYTLTYGDVTIPYNLTLGSDIDMCSGSNFEYTPISGIFNVVHDDYYNSSTSYYNLPTQVTNREGNFKVISTDPADNNQLKATSTIVAVEMIDVSGYHETDPSCKEVGSTISERVWVIFDDATSVPFDRETLISAVNNNMTNISQSSDFYKNARENAAFRVSYNSVDQNNTIPYLAKDNNGDYQILNWTMNWEGESCAQDMGGSNNLMSSYCNLTNNNFTEADLASCMECIYGIDTRFVCSMDNFSIRPEAFLINLNDQNQSNVAVQTELTTNYSGVAVPTPDVLHLSAGYNYNLEVNATSFLDNRASNGYTRSFNASTLDDLSQYTWKPRSSITESACNDVDHKLTEVGFTNGIADVNTSADQIGEYTLEIVDTTWTTVDNNPLYMAHHTGSYFLGSDIPDCIKNSNVVQLNDPYPTTEPLLNGCNISSNHSNANADLVYNDLDVTLHPYKFSISATPSVGIATGTPIPTNPYVYMADLSFNNSQDLNMSFHLNGTIKAVGYDNGELSNFVSSCYAKDLDLNISKSDTTLLDTSANQVSYRAKLQNLNLQGAIIASDTLDVVETDHTTPLEIQTTQGHFTKDLSGALNTRLHLNYHKENNVTVNPIRINYAQYDVTCSNPLNDCTFNADLSDSTTATGSLAIDQNITHYYGRTHAPLYRYDSPSGDGFIYYEVYCSGTGCDKSLLQDGVDSKYNDDPRWLINTKHTAPFGTASFITQKGTRVNITAKNDANTNIATGNHPDKMTFTYDENLGYTYRGTMENNASRWLIYNPYDANDTTNEFDIEYTKEDSGWSGAHATDSSTTNEGAQRTNRRIMW